MAARENTGVMGFMPSDAHRQDTAQESVRTCQSCAYYVGDTGEHAGKCTVGQLINPVTGERHGGGKSGRYLWQSAYALRTAPPLFTTCGQRGELWDALF
jgi:hypothetical protein